MPYKLFSLTDGERPGSEYVDASYTPGTGEVVVPNAEWEDPAKADWVWDAANNRLRAPNDADRLKWAKRDGKREVENRGVREMHNTMDVYRALVLLARNTTPRDSRLAGLTAIDDKITAKLREVESATTLSGVESAKKWEA